MNQADPPPSSAFAGERPVHPLALRLRLPAILCAVALALAAVIIHPVLERGVNDDFAYTRVALDLARTGHIHYNGWEEPVLGWQLLPAAVGIRLFGFSFTMIRWMLFPVSMLAAFLMQRCLVRSGIREWNAVIATLTIILCPLFVSLSLSYMTDIPSFLVMVVCLYGCLRAVQARSSSATVGWIVFAALMTAVGGTARQVAWMGDLVMVPCALWVVRRRPGVLLPGLVALVGSFAFMVWVAHWFALQPYSLSSTLLPSSFDRSRIREVFYDLTWYVLEAGLFLLPLLAAYLEALRRCSRKAALLALVPALLFTVVMGAKVARRHAAVFGLLPMLPNYVTEHGVIDGTPMLGHRPVVLSPEVRWILTSLVVAGLCALAAVWLERRGNDRSEAVAEQPAAIAWKDLLVLVLPFTATLALFVVDRDVVGAAFDRYLLPFLFVFSILMVRLYQERVDRSLPVVSVVFVVVVGAYSVAATHDVFAMFRGEMAAVNQMRAAGVAPATIDGGFEYNGWKRLESGGFLNGATLRHGYVVPPRPDPADHCHPLMIELMPGFSPQYALSFDRDACGGATEFSPVVYRTWLPPHTANIYIVRYGPNTN